LKLASLGRAEAEKTPSSSIRAIDLIIADWLMQDKLALPRSGGKPSISAYDLEMQSQIARPHPARQGDGDS
jgi:hypothetical protein